MPNPRSLLKWVQYVPIAYEIMKSVIPATEPAANDTKVRTELADFERSMTGRFSDLENEVARLRGRLRETESLIMALQQWLWIGGGVLAVLVVILLIAVLWPHR
jgi:hypothetical protein